MSRIRYAVVAVGAAVVGAAAATGFALATTTSPSVKACTNSSGFLVLADASGQCPSGATAVTINERGPKGAPGLAARSAVLDRTTAGGSVTRTLPKGDQLSLTCGSDDGVPSPILTVEAADLSDVYYVHGTAQVGAGGGTVDYDSPGATQTFSVGSNLIGQSPTGYFRLGAVGISGPAYGSVRVLVNDGTDVFTLDVSLYSATGRCQMIVEATPAT